MPSYLITGASRGLGYAFLRTLALQSPSNTVLGLVRDVPRTLARLSADPALTPEQAKNIHLFGADITSPTALSDAASGISALTSGTLDVLIHNAAYISQTSGGTTLLDHAPQELEDDLMESFRSNVVGAAHVINAFLPLIRKGELKKVVVISTGAADTEWTKLFNFPVAGPYAISKAGVNMLVTKYHTALGHTEGVCFFALSPGVVDTTEGNGSMEAITVAFKEMLKGHKDYAPNWDGPITPEESVGMCLQVIEDATVEKVGGGFVSHHGNKTWL